MPTGERAITEAEFRAAQELYTELVNYVHVQAHTQDPGVVTLALFMVAASLYYEYADPPHGPASWEHLHASLRLLLEKHPSHLKEN